VCGGIGLCRDVWTCRVNLRSRCWRNGEVTPVKDGEQGVDNFSSKRSEFVGESSARLHLFRPDVVNGRQQRSSEDRGTTAVSTSTRPDESEMDYTECGGEDPPCLCKGVKAVCRLNTELPLAGVMDDS
jgi:hypothetical protein